MIPQIQQINFPSYASLTNAVATFADMGERTISTQIKIDGDVVPDFDGWELSFKGERFVLPVKEPQAAKDNTSRRSMVDLVFYSWPIDELKRYFFVEMASITSGTAIADKYKASLGLSLENFVTAFNNVLDYYFNGRIVMSLFGSGTGIYSNEPAYVEIDYTKIWDVLQKVYEVYEVRWNIEYDSINDIYTIKVGYPSPEIDDHEFEYGYEGGLLRFERQVQDYDLTNILLGRGGEKNLPYRYFKEVDPNNPSWAGDPDAIPELANIYFENLRDINFRRYVQGWKTNSNRILEEGQTVDTYDSERGQTDFAYAKGHTDETFNPVEYVKDDDSIAIYGERWGALDNAEDIYPTIQGIEISPYGRIDQVVDVEDVVTDDIEAMAADAAEITNVVGAERSEWINYNSTIEVVINGADFSVPAGKVGNLTFVNTWFDTIQYAKQGNHQVSVSDSDPVHELVGINTTLSYMKVVDKSTSLEIAPSGIPAGNYYYKLYITVKAEFEQSMYTAVNVTVGVDGLKLTTSDSNANAWKPTFDIWVKNIWNTTQGGSESDTAYAARVWEPILGDRTGNEAKISFSTGLLSISEDYNFTIASIPVVDRTKTINGVTSEWRITLIKSDAEYQATGKYIPNADTGGNASAGDYFFFTGIDMPHAYVLWAEEKLNAYKTTELGKLKQINPTWVIKIDKVRANTLLTGETVALADRLTCGAKIDISDSRFTNGNTLTLYAQTITYTWQEPSSGNPYIVPDIEVVLSDKVETVTSPIDKLEGSVDLIQSSYARISDIESIVRKVANPLYLKKTGESEKSLSPTRFSSIIASEEFRQGDFGGQGWGAYIDGDGHSVYEADVLVARKGMRVNTLVINQVAYLGGKQIISAAAIECTKVEVDGNGDYVCYFDQKQGSVANNFVVNDIVLGQVWNADDTQQRYYKRKVTAVTSDSITLSATIADGTDAPQVGDVMVQFGNYTQSARQYVIVRDVIGGGYERMLSGLSTVYSTGDEYYFAGRQSGSTERWFVGNSSGQYAQYQNGVLTIAGRLAVTTQIDTGNGNYEALSSYLSNLQDQIDGNVQTWYASGVPTLQNYPASTWPTVEDKNNHIGDLYYDSATGKAYRFMYDGTEEVYLWTQIADEDIAAALALAQQNATDISGLQYLKTATNNGTLIQGGLVLTSLIQLGQIESSVYKVYSGINGIMDGTAQGSGIAAWYGGEMLEKSVWDTYNSTQQAAHRYAKSLFRFDGSGYLASENIKWDANGNGQIPGISWNNGTITLSSSIYLEGGDRLTEVVDAVNRMYTQFAYDSHDNIVVKPTEALYIPDHAPLYPLAGSNALYVDYNGNYPVTPGSSVTTVGLLYIKNGGVTAGPWDLKTGDQTADISTLFNGYALQSWVSSNFNNYVLPVAASNVLGGVKVGTGLSIDANGVLTATYAYSLPIASSSTLGGIKVGSGLSINSSTGVLSATYSYTLPTASADTKGGVKIGTGLSMSGEVLSLSSETQTSLGKADTAYQKPSGGIPDSDLADAYLPLTAGSGKALTGSLYTTSNIYFRRTISGQNVTVGCLSYELSSGDQYLYYTNPSVGNGIGAGEGLAIHSCTNGTRLLYWTGSASDAKEIYHEGNLTKSVLTTLLESSNGYYVKKAGDTMTGDLTFDASSANRHIYFKYVNSGLASALRMSSSGTLLLGENQRTNAKSTTIYGSDLFVNFGSDSTPYSVVFSGGVVRPFNSTINLGSSSYRWSGMYSNGANLDTFLAIPQSAPSTSASWYSANDAYLYADTSGNYSEEAGGGVANVYPLTITINGTSTVYNPGSAAQTVSFGVPTSAQISAWNAKYDKPSTGIPKTDLASAVQTSLGKADSALQSVAFSDLTTHPTTISGYGITDAKIETPSGTTNKKITLGSNNFTIYSWALASSKPSYAFSDLTAHPTTISGYGITDAKIETPSGTSNRKITLGSNNFTIYAWALASSKPSYTLDDVADGSTRKLADYLPLTGGYVSSSENNNPLRIKTTLANTNGVYIPFYVSTTKKAEVGYWPGYGAYLANTAGTTQHTLKVKDDGTLGLDSYTVYHTGNLSLATLAGSSAVGSSTQPVYYTGSALAACDLSTTYAPYNANGYLPLSAGSSYPLTGTLYTNQNLATYKAIAIKGTNTERCSIGITNGYLSLASNGSEISVSGGSDTQLYINYRKAHDGYAPASWYLMAGTNTSYASLYAGVVRPGLDNSYTLGGPSNRWSAIYGMAGYLYGDLTFDASSAAKSVYYKTSDNTLLRALYMTSGGDLAIGYDNTDRSKNTNVDGYNLNLRAGSAKQYTIQLGSTGVVTLTGLSSVLPNTTNTIDLGSTSKIFKNLYADKLWGLFGTSSESSAVFTHRATPSTAVGDSGVIKSIKGYSVVWNQQVSALPLASGSYSGLTITNNGDGSYTFSGTTNALFDKQIATISGIAGHKYYVYVGIPSCTVNFASTPNGTTGSAGSVIYTPNTSTAKLYVTVSSGVAINKRIYPIVVDLTLMFGSGSEPSTVEQFEALYPMRNYSYNAGEVVSLTAAKKVKLNNQAASYDSSSWALLSSTYCAKTTNATTQAIILTSKSNSSAAKGVKLNNFSFVVGHKYYIRAELDPTTHIGFYSSSNAVIFNTDVSRKGVVGEVTSSTSYFGLRLSNSAVNNTSYTFRNIMCVDLTLMYGEGFEPSAREFEHDFPQEYIPYNATGVDATIQGGLQTGGFNQWDEEWELGTIDGNGQDVANSTRIRSKGYIPVFPNTTYFLRQVTDYLAETYCYDSQHNYLGHTSYTLQGQSFLITTLPNTAYMRFNLTSGYGTTYKGDICINLSDTSRNGTYEPHWESTLPLPITTITSGGKRIFPDGLAGVGSVYDELTGTKAVKRFGKVDMGALNWTYNSAYGFYLHPSNLPADCSTSTSGVQIKCAKYATTGISNQTNVEKLMIGYNSMVARYFYVKDSTYSDVPSFIAAMTGVYIYYELATPTEYTLDSPIPLHFKSDKLGTQTLTPENTAVVSTAPLKADFQYGSNLGDAAGANEGYLPLAGGRVTGELNVAAGELVIPDHAPYQPEPNKHYLYVNDNGNYYQS